MASVVKPDKNNNTQVTIQPPLILVPMLCAHRYTQVPKTLINQCCC